MSSPLPNQGGKFISSPPSTSFHGIAPMSFNPPASGPNQPQYSTPHQPPTSPFIVQSHSFTENSNTDNKFTMPTSSAHHQPAPFHVTEHQTHHPSPTPPISSIPSFTNPNPNANPNPNPTPNLKQSSSSFPQQHPFAPIDPHSGSFPSHSPHPPTSFPSNSPFPNTANASPFPGATNPSASPSPPPNTFPSSTIPNTFTSPPPAPTTFSPSHSIPSTSSSPPAMPGTLPSPPTGPTGFPLPSPSSSQFPFASPPPNKPFPASTFSEGAGQALPSPPPLSMNASNAFPHTTEGHSPFLPPNTLSANPSKPFPSPPVPTHQGAPLTPGNVPKPFASTGPMGVAPFASGGVSNLSQAPNAPASAFPSSMPGKNVFPPGVPGANAFPSPAPSANAFPSSVSSANAFSSPAPIAKVFPSSIPAANAFPSSGPSPNIIPTPAPSANIFPSPTPSANVFPSSTPTTNAFPSPAPSVNAFPSPPPATNAFPQATIGSSANTTSSLPSPATVVNNPSTSVSPVLGANQFPPVASAFHSPPSFPTPNTNTPIPAGVRNPNTLPPAPPISISPISPIPSMSPPLPTPFASTMQKSTSNNNLPTPANSLANSNISPSAPTPFPNAPAFTAPPITTSNLPYQPSPVSSASPTPYLNPASGSTAPQKFYSPPANSPAPFNPTLSASVHVRAVSEFAFRRPKVCAVSFCTNGEMLFAFPSETANALQKFNPPGKTFVALDIAAAVLSGEGRATHVASDMPFFDEPDMDRKGREILIELFPPGRQTSVAASRPFHSTLLPRPTVRLFAGEKLPTSLLPPLGANDAKTTEKVDRFLSSSLESLTPHLEAIATAFIHQKYTAPEARALCDNFVTSANEFHQIFNLYGENLMLLTLQHLLHNQGSLGDAQRLRAALCDSLLHVQRIILSQSPETALQAHLCEFEIFTPCAHSKQNFHQEFAYLLVHVSAESALEYACEHQEFLFASLAARLCDKEMETLQRTFLAHYGLRQSSTSVSLKHTAHLSPIENAINRIVADILLSLLGEVNITDRSLPSSQWCERSWFFLWPTVVLSLLLHQKKLDSLSNPATIASVLQWKTISSPSAFSGVLGLLATFLESVNFVPVSHFILMILRARVQPLDDENSTLTLFGLNKMKRRSFARLFDPFVIQCTEIFEYSQRTVAPEFFFPPLIPFKIRFCEILMDLGFAKNATTCMNLLSAFVRATPSTSVSLMLRTDLKRLETRYQHSNIRTSHGVAHASKTANVVANTFSSLWGGLKAVVATSATNPPPANPTSTSANSASTSARNTSASIANVAANNANDTAGSGMFASIFGGIKKAVRGEDTPGDDSPLVGVKNEYYYCDQNKMWRRRGYEHEEKEVPKVAPLPPSPLPPPPANAISINSPSSPLPANNYIQMGSRALYVHEDSSSSANAAPATNNAAGSANPFGGFAPLQPPKPATPGHVISSPFSVLH